MVWRSREGWSEGNVTQTQPTVKFTSKEEGSYPGNLGTTTQSHHIQERENSATERRDTVLVTYIKNENTENKGEEKKDWMQQNFFVIQLKAELWKEVQTKQLPNESKTQIPSHCEYSSRTL